MNDWSDEKTDDPLYADDRNFYKGGGAGSGRHGYRCITRGINAQRIQKLPNNIRGCGWVGFCRHIFCDRMGS